MRNSMVFVLAVFMFMNLCIFALYQNIQSIGMRPVPGPPVSRSDVIRTADQYARLHWTMSNQNRFGKNCAGGFVSQYPVGNRIGVGYKWGGWTHIDEFKQKIKLGFGTGTGGHVSYTGYSIDCVVGISCTGLVSRAWNLSRKYTLDYPERPDIPYQFDDITEKLDDVDLKGGKLGRLKKGDALMNRTHIVLFVYETRDGHPVVLDSRSVGVGYRKTTWQEMINGKYHAIRYHNIIDDAAISGTAAKPIDLELEGMPIDRNGNTRDVVSMIFDRYECKESSNQQGPELIYRFRVKKSQSLLFQINDLKNEGIDNDLFLLKSLRRSGFRSLDTIGSGDFKIKKTLEQGTYYLVVDSGMDMAGEFQLRIRRSD